MKRASSLELLHLNDRIPVAASRGSCNDVFIKGKRNENYDDEKIDNSADGSHAFRSKSSNKIY